MFSLSLSQCMLGAVRVCESLALYLLMCFCLAAAVLQKVGFVVWRQLPEELLGLAAGGNYSSDK